mmetsp:Transcript_271/g.899  ORF Transcript_271/g.899 Transcript_271/m.899 type:complete len:260 (+) Transcript_271:236-1015(+)
MRARLGVAEDKVAAGDARQRLHVRVHRALLAEGVSHEAVAGHDKVRLHAAQRTHARRLACHLLQALLSPLADARQAEGVCAAGQQAEAALDWLVANPALGRRGGGHLLRLHGATLLVRAPVLVRHDALHVGQHVRVPAAVPEATVTPQKERARGRGGRGCGGGGRGCSDRRRQRRCVVRRRARHRRGLGVRHRGCCGSSCRGSVDESAGGAVVVRLVVRVPIEAPQVCHGLRARAVAQGAAGRRLLRGGRWQHRRGVRL